jgi:alpha-glucosidase (family GH31 glycosyl hydrolase)
MPCTLSFIKKSLKRIEMNTMERQAGLVIRHEPLGEQHPYEVLPWERNPRYPASGEAVTLGFAIAGSKRAGSAWCEWWEEGNAIPQHARGILKDSDEVNDYWQVVLPAFEGKETIHYRLVARNEEEQVQTGEFMFVVRKWVAVKSVFSLEAISDGWVASLMTDQADLWVRLTVKISESGTVDFCFAREREPGNTGGVHPSFRIGKGEIQIRFYERAFGMEIAFSKEQAPLKCEAVWLLIDGDGAVAHYRLEFNSAEDEAFFGFGERFNALDQRGNCLINHLFAQYLHQGERSYIPIPFFISSHIYGFWLDTAQWAKFDLAAGKPDRWLVEGEAEGSALRFKVFFQDDPYAIVKAFTDITGKPALPPPWVFGLWMSSNDWNSQQEVLRQLDLSQKNQILSTVLVIEAWSDESTYYIWNGAQFLHKPSDQSYQFTDFSFPRNGYWPNLREMVQKVHAAGSHVVLWQIPVLKLGNPDEHSDETQSRQDREYAISKEYVVHRADGTPHFIEGHMPWFAGSSLLDFTNPEARRWWFEKRAYLLDELGIDGFKTDGGEHIWDTQTVFSNGEQGRTGINHYPLWYESSYRRFLDEHRRGLTKCRDDRVLFSRAGYTGIQQYSCHWAGDEGSTWDAFRATLRAMLNVGLGGISFIGWDIAGFAGEIPASELYLRAAAFSVFCPIMQFHSDVNARRIPSRDRTPWNIQERTGDLTVIPTFRSLTNLRMNLLPYLLAEAWKSSQTGIPLMRALPLAFPDDPDCRKYPYQYLFGDALMVAPVINEGEKEIPIYLPHGEWQDIWERKLYRGPREIQRKVPMDRIAVFQRKRSILPLNLGEEGCLGSFVGNSTDSYRHLFLRIFPDKEEKYPLYSGADGTVHWIHYAVHDLEKRMEIDLPEVADGIQIELIGVRAFEVSTAHGILKESQNTAGELGEGAWKYVPSKQSTQIRIPARRNYTQIRISY